ncbi:MAG: hypothetical protein HC818_06580 [Synechococcaceae cyanobacterium RM1_1_27]|nr:hypothetical protein [Synechococcaceae cyanobacterium RM1_1_27]
MPLRPTGSQYGGQRIPGSMDLSGLYPQRESHRSMPYSPCHFLETKTIGKLY